MKITRKFTTPGVDPFSTVKWSKRSSKITNPDGSVVFQMDDAEVPETWSQLATDIMVSKYFRKAGVPMMRAGQDALKGDRQLDDSGKAVTGPEKSAKQVIHRLAGCWRQWGERHNYFDTVDDAQAFYDELSYMLIHQVCAPNSPQWFNTGLHFAYGISGPAQGHFVPDPKTGEVSLAKDAYTHPQPHACLIQIVSDDLVNDGGIMDLWVREARLFKYGSGTGSNFSNLRGDGEKLSGGGRSSGLMSWLRIGDRAASAIKSGGTTRRAAKMVCLDMDHPDILEFVQWKVREEIKVQAMVEGLALLKKAKPELAAQCEELKLKLDYDYNGEAYATVAGQNSNNSVRIPDAFFEAIDAGSEWHTYHRTSKKLARTFDARTLWDKIGDAAWRCADPGVQYDSTINAWHTCPSAGRINASNPCVTGDTLVAMTTGLRRIDSLAGETPEIIAGDGNSAYATKVWKTGTKPVYELTTRAGYRLRLTGDHKVFTLNRGDVPACELTIDDVVELRGAGFGNDFVPESFGELLGAAIGDGCVTRQPDQDFLFVTLGEGERDVAERLRSGIDASKDWLATGDARGTRPSTITATATGVRVGTSVQRVIDTMARYAVLDQGSHKKALTDQIHTLDKPSIAAMLRGLFTADGTVADYGSKSQYVSLDSTSEQLLAQVQMLLLSFGVKSKLYKNRRALGQTTSLLPDGKGGANEYPVQQMHSLRISRSSRVVFEREVGFLQGSKKSQRLHDLNARVDAYADKLTDRVASLTPAGVEDVYDLTEPRTSHFIANGVVVHNCSEYMFLDNTACNLASLNVLKFYDSKSRAFDADRFEHAIDLWTMVLEISVLMASFPSKDIAALSWKYRTLGLGYANLGAMLMQAGLPYDSDEARAVCACLSAILTGRSYRCSALMAQEHGPFPGYVGDRENMLRVIRNHRLAAHGVPRESDRYEGLNIRPVPIDHTLIKVGKVPVANMMNLLARSVRAWDDALEMGLKHGFRNAQTTVIAPTGTIGLLMDCDTTGVEPDFALVKFKKLAGGGYFKIANESVRPALKALGYSDAHIRDIMEYLLGKLSLDVAIEGDPQRRTLLAFLKEKGLPEKDIDAVSNSLPGVFDLSFAFAGWSVSPEGLIACGVDPAAAAGNPKFNLLREIGLTTAQIDSLATVICGVGTIEGAPHLRQEHVAVFDCANKCGRFGKRFIVAEGHIRMMAAAQPFISGAISKTINLPNEATTEEIKACYRLSWELGLKANALYRDGCKLSQPLSSTSDEAKKESGQEETSGKEPAANAGTDGATGAARRAAAIDTHEPVHAIAEAKPSLAVSEHESDSIVASIAASTSIASHAAPSDSTVVRAKRSRLPDTRRSFTHKFNVAGHEGYLTVGLFEDGQPGELFITMSKEGSTIGGLMDSLGTATSIALQYGVPVSSLVAKFSHQRFEPAGLTENSDIPIAKSLVDYIFRWMGMQFVPGYREANSPRYQIAREKGVPIAPSNEEPAWPLDTGGRFGDMGDTEATHSRGGVSADHKPKQTISPQHKAPPYAGVRTPGSPATGKPADRVDRATAMAGTLSAAMDAVSDSPACDVCGTITVRSGTCYKCVNCGNSMGCS